MSDSNAQIDELIASGATEFGKDEILQCPSDNCLYCGGQIAIRNPTGNCDHLYWPDMLTDDAKAVNGYSRVEQRIIVWVKEAAT